MIIHTVYTINSNKIGKVYKNATNSFDTDSDGIISEDNLFTTDFKL